ncbi:MAG: Lrp/AsnC family transcriptional regulator [Candidatus Bathyarchaeota archaeon]|jgi:DNA-binding Lrp family transcriptional regulator|nr:Lrp/AsnC family transcriptional regulator [Candidatus Bathyarchaeota archaeon A05DMB-3]MDH7607457.1 Lrp/AsnC family transcriptional regulator [Candidatus Bathyarchaeota archaeon]
MEPRLDEKDLAILNLLQKNCRMTAKEIARKIDSPITTVFAKIKRMEQQGIIKEYRAILDHKKLNFGVTAFILASFSYRTGKNEETPLSQRAIAEQISKFPEVQEVHIISGDWDILIKVKDKDVDAIGKFVVDKLRTVKGIEKTLTCMVFDTPKETTAIPVPLKTPKQL